MAIGCFLRSPALVFAWELRIISKYRDHPQENLERRKICCHIMWMYFEIKSRVTERQSCALREM